MALEIREEDTGSITTIKALTGASLEKFISALKTAPLASSPQEMAAYIAKQVPSIPTDKLERVLSTIYTLYQIRELSGVDHSRFLNDLLEGIQKNSNLQIHKKELPKLRSLLDRFMSIDSLNTIAKAFRLQRDGERLFCTAKILSDIRPVFGSDPASRPVGTVLIHTLKVGYHEGRNHREFHVVLDSGDLTKLGDTIQRAQTKDKSLRGLLKDVDLPGLDE